MSVKSEICSVHINIFISDDMKSTYYCHTCNDCVIFYSGFTKHGVIRKMGVVIVLFFSLLKLG